MLGCGWSLIYLSDIECIDVVPRFFVALSCAKIWGKKTFFVDVAENTMFHEFHKMAVGHYDQFWRRTN